MHDNLETGERAGEGFMYEVASVALDVLFDQLSDLAGDWAGKIAGRSGSAPDRPVRTLTIQNHTPYTASVALCVGRPNETEYRSLDNWCAGWYNVPGGGSLARRVTILYGGSPIVLYAQAPDVKREWSGSTPMYITRPEAFCIRNARSQNARLTEGTGLPEVVNGDGIMMQKDFTFHLR